jgi:predicted nucleotidyltransferase
MTLDMTGLAKLAREEVPGALFATVSGAHLYGFPSADSDVDLRGCHRLPLERLVGLRPPVETVEVKRVLAGTEVELVSHEAGKYLRLLSRHNGYVLEQVFSPLVVHGQEFLDALRPLARRCITRRCYHHYRGFLNTQLRLLEREPVKKAKTLLYAYRVVVTGVHLLRTGEVQANLVELNRHFGLPFLEELIRRKQAREQGELTELDWGAHRKELARWEARLDEAFASSPLPEAPNWDDLNDFLLRLRLPREKGPTTLFPPA